MASLCFFVQLPDRTPILAKGVFLCTSFGRSLFWNHSPSEWFFKYKKMESILLSIAFYFPDFALRRASALERAACV